MTEEQYIAEMDSELEQQLHRVAEIEHADYSLSAEAVDSLQNNEETKHIFATLEQQLGTYTQILGEDGYPDYYPRYGLSSLDDM